jgi:hypothetical protein
MSDELLTTREAAHRLGISRTSFYDWLAQSNAGQFVLRGHATTIQHFQGGAKGQGRIKLEAQEVERLRDLMRVQPRPQTVRRPAIKQTEFPGIRVKLGRPSC